MSVGHGPTWYADEAAKRVHEAFSAAMHDILQNLMSGYELSHMGVDRRSDPLGIRGDEVVLRLHLNPIGAVRVTPDGRPASDFEGLT